MLSGEHAVFYIDYMHLRNKPTIQEASEIKYAYSGV